MPMKYGQQGKFGQYQVQRVVCAHRRGWQRGGHVQDDDRRPGQPDGTAGEPANKAGAVDHGRRRLPSVPNTGNQEGKKSKGHERNAPAKHFGLDHGEDKYTKGQGNQRPAGQAQNIRRMPVPEGTRHMYERRHEVHHDHRGERLERAKHLHRDRQVDHCGAEAREAPYDAGQDRAQTQKPQPVRLGGNRERLKHPRLQTGCLRRRHRTALTSHASRPASGQRSWPRRPRNRFRRSRPR